ncbi:MAG: hypothetical protein CME06_12570 [Gemmatimonadetes bacterium]|nr:hypothetical protein [Gemmatimonadota bacterium]
MHRWGIHSADDFPSSVANYLRPSFELAYRLTCDLDHAATVAEEALLRAARSGLSSGREALTLCFEEVVVSCRGTGGRALPPARWDLDGNPAELRRAVRSAIPGLPMPARAALILREAFELGDADVARILSVETGGVAELVDEARIALASPTTWSSGAAPPPSWRPAALGVAPGSPCARVRASHNAEVDGSVPAIEGSEAQEHRSSCDACREHRELIQLAHALTRHATPPSLQEAFWRERRRAIEEAWTREKVAAPAKPSIRAAWPVAAILAGIVLVTWLLSRGPEQTTEPQESQAAAPRIEPEQPAPPVIDRPPRPRAPEPPIEERRLPPPRSTEPVEKEPQPELPAAPAEQESTREAPPDSASADSAAPALDELYRRLEALPRISPGSATLRPLTRTGERVD